MTNPSIEYMRRIRREERVKLLDMRRERTVKALRSLDLHGGSHAMLSQIAYAIHPHVGAWDAESCDHLRNVLAELIGDAHEATSGAEHACSCGAGGCGCGHESAEVGDLSHNTSSMRQESETEITDELRKYISIHETTTTVYATMPPQVEEKPTHKGEKLLAIADKIDGRTEAMAHDVEMWRNRAEDMCVEYDELQVKLGELQANLDELERFDPEISIAAFGDDNEELRKLLSRAAKLLADAERDRDENYHLWMDCKQKVLQSNITVGELEEECEELQGTIADLNEQLERRKAKCLRYKTHIDQMQGGSMRLRKELSGQEGMYLDLLRDAARDYKAMQDKLNLVFDMWVNATNGGAHE